MGRKSCEYENRGCVGTYLVYDSHVVHLMRLEIFNHLEGLPQVSDAKFISSTTHNGSSGSENESGSPARRDIGPRWLVGVGFKTDPELDFHGEYGKNSGTAAMEGHCQLAALRFMIHSSTPLL